MSRRDDLLDQVTDHVLEHGLIGLTLRPLAAAIGTSDRMLIYHFHSRDALVSEVVARATARAIGEVEALPDAPTVQVGRQPAVAGLLRAAVELDADALLPGGGQRADRRGALPLGCPREQRAVGDGPARLLPSAAARRQPGSRAS